MSDEAAAMPNRGRISSDECRRVHLEVKIEPPSIHDELRASLSLPSTDDESPYGKGLESKHAVGSSSRVANELDVVDCANSPPWPKIKPEEGYPLEAANGSYVSSDANSTPWPKVNSEVGYSLEAINDAYVLSDASRPLPPKRKRGRSISSRNKRPNLNITVDRNSQSLHSSIRHLTTTQQEPVTVPTAYNGEPSRPILHSLEYEEHPIPMEGRRKPEWQAIDRPDSTRAGQHSNIKGKNPAGVTHIPVPEVPSTTPPGSLKPTSGVPAVSTIAPPDTPVSVAQQRDFEIRIEARYRQLHAALYRMESGGPPLPDTLRVWLENNARQEREEMFRAGVFSKNSRIRSLAIRYQRLQFDVRHEDRVWWDQSVKRQIEDAQKQLNSAIRSQMRRARAITEEWNEYVIKYQKRE